MSVFLSSILILDDVRRAKCRAELVPYVSDQLAIDSTTLIAKLKNTTAYFPNSEYLDSRVSAMWPKLPMEARLIACLWAREKSEWDDYIIGQLDRE